MCEYNYSKSKLPNNLTPTLAQVMTVLCSCLPWCKPALPPVTRFISNERIIDITARVTKASLLSAGSLSNLDDEKESIPISCKQCCAKLNYSNPNGIDCVAFKNDVRENYRGYIMYDYNTTLEFNCPQCFFKNKTTPAPIGKTIVRCECHTFYAVPYSFPFFKCNNDECQKTMLIYNERKGFGAGFCPYCNNYLSYKNTVMNPIRSVFCLNCKKSSWVNKKKQQRICLPISFMCIFLLIGCIVYPWVAHLSGKSKGSAIFTQFVIVIGLLAWLYVARSSFKNKQLVLLEDGPALPNF